jgi:hypothetical protein
MCDILPPRRFSLAPADHGSSFEKKREEILQRPIKIASQPQPKPVQEGDVQLEDMYVLVLSPFTAL